MKFLIQVSITHLPTRALNVILTITNTFYSMHSNHILKYGFPAPFFWRICFLHCIFLPPLSKIRCPQVHGFISGLSILFHLSIFLLLWRYHTVLSTVALVWSAIREPDSSTFIFLCQDRFGYIGFSVCVCFYTNCKMFNSSFMKNAIGNLIGLHWICTLLWVK